MSNGMSKAMSEEFHPKLTVIIPSKRGETRLATLITETLSALTANQELRDCDVECIVSLHIADPVPLPKFSNLKVLRTDIESRGHQMNMAAHISRAPWLWFLHADSKLEKESYASVFEKVLGAKGEDEIFYFPLRFDSASKLARLLNAPLANLRSKFFKLPFGDQSFLLTRASFEKIGAFPQVFKSGEDHAFIQTAKRLGFKISPLKGFIETSSRKYQEKGWLRTSARHLYLTLKQELPGSEHLESSNR